MYSALRKATNTSLGLIAALSLILVGCGGGGGNQTNSVTPISIASVNAMLATSSSPLPGGKLSCTGSSIAGCFTLPTCHRSSDYFSTRTVYDIGASRIMALSISYQSSDCSGAATLSNTLYGQWNYTLNQYDSSSMIGRIGATLVHYADGYLFDPNQPVIGVIYSADIQVTTTNGQAKLCVSSPLIDATRPLKFMSTTALPLDLTNCAIGLL